MVKIAPSILSADFAAWVKKFARLMKQGATISMSM